MDNEPVTKEINNNFGVVEIRQLKFGENSLHVCTVNDRDGSRISLPIIRPGVMAKIAGKNKVELMDITTDELDYLNQALEKLPYLLAVHATFNQNPRPNLEDFPFPKDKPIPIVGVEGPPHSGKTALLLALAAYDGQDHHGVRDFDPFSQQSLESCLAILKSQIPGDINYADPQDIMEKCMQIYVESNHKPTSSDNSKVTLKSKLDQLLDEFRSQDDRDCYIFDQPGIDKNTKCYDVFHLLSATIPPVDLSESISKIMPLDQLTSIPLKDRFRSAGAYLFYLRSKVFPIRGPEYHQISLLDQAVTIHHLIQAKLSNKQPDLIQ